MLKYQSYLFNTTSLPELQYQKSQMSSAVTQQIDDLDARLTAVENDDTTEKLMQDLVNASTLLAS